MNVTAKEIVLHIEEKMIQLQQAVDRGEEERVKEHATEIAAYCQLLKGTAKRSNTSEVTKILSSPSPTTPSPSGPSGDELGNLFDF